MKTVENIKTEELEELEYCKAPFTQLSTTADGTLALVASDVFNEENRKKILRFITKTYLDQEEDRTRRLIQFRAIGRQTIRLALAAGHLRELFQDVNISRYFLHPVWANHISPMVKEATRMGLASERKKSSPLYTQNQFHAMLQLYSPEGCNELHKHQPKVNMDRLVKYLVALNRFFKDPTKKLKLLHQRGEGDLAYDLMEMSTSLGDRSDWLEYGDPVHEVLKMVVIDLQGIWQALQNGRLDQRDKEGFTETREAVSKILKPIEDKVKEEEDDVEPEYRVGVRDEVSRTRLRTLGGLSRKLYLLNQKLNRYETDTYQAISQRRRDMVATKIRVATLLLEVYSSDPELWFQKDLITI